MKVVGKKSVSAILAAVLKVIFVLFLLATVVLVIMYITGRHKIEIHEGAIYFGLIPRGFPDMEPSLGLVILRTVMNSLFLLIVYSLQRVFNNFVNGSVFVQDNARRIRTAGIAVMVQAPVKMMVDFGLYMQVREYVARQELELQGLPTGASLNFYIVLMGLLALVIAQIFAMATEIAEENSLTI